MSGRGIPWDDGVTWYTSLSTAPTDLVVHLDYFRDDHLRVTNGDVEDDRLTRAIEAATRQCEAFTGRALLPQTWELVLNRFPVDQIVLPKPPLLDVTSVSYVDTDGNSQSLVEDTDYRVLRQAGPAAQWGQIVRVYNTAWPATRWQRDAVTVTFRAGYVETVGASPEVTNVPDDIKEGIAMRAAELYKQRSESVIGIGIAVAPAVVASRTLWAPYRVF